MSATLSAIWDHHRGWIDPITLDAATPPDNDTAWGDYVDSLVDSDPTTEHAWQYGNAIRQCAACGTREAYWDDDEYPINPCRAAWSDNVRNGK